MYTLYVMHANANRAYRLRVVLHWSLYCHQYVLEKVAIVVLVLVHVPQIAGP